MILELMHGSFSPVTSEKVQVMKILHPCIILVGQAVEEMKAEMLLISLRGQGGV